MRSMIASKILCNLILYSLNLLEFVCALHYLKVIFQPKVLFTLLGILLLINHFDACYFL